jgi:hypothetical protein
MRVLLGYSYYQHPVVDVKTRVEAWLARLRLQGIAVDSFCLTPDAPGPRLSWAELDRRWREIESCWRLYRDLRDDSRI